MPDGAASGPWTIPCQSAHVPISMPFFPQILERYLGLDPSPAGQGVSWTWSIDPPVAIDSAGPCLLLLALVAAALVFSRRDFHRIPRRARYGILLLRLTSIGLLTLMICRVSLNAMRTGDPIVAVLVDVSPSMTAADEYEPTLRARLAKWLNVGRGTRRIDLVQRLVGSEKQPWLDQIEKGRRVEVFTFSEDVGEEDVRAQLTAVRSRTSRSHPLHTSGKRTNLRASLTNLLNRYRGAPPDAVVILTDGVSTTGEGNSLSHAGNLARRMQVPLFVVGIGSSRAVRDLAIAEIHTDSVAFLGDRHAFQVKLNASRIPEGKTTIVLSHAGQRDVLDSAEVTFRNGETSYSVELSHVPDGAGAVDYSVIVQPVPGESNPQNNRAQARVWVRQERLRALLIERLPRWEFRHLKAVLERDRTVDLKTWLQDADADFVREDRTALSRLPANLEELSSYDAIILGDIDPDHLPPGFLESVEEFVGSLGGGLFFLAGPKHVPGAYLGGDWERLLPVMRRTSADAEPKFVLFSGSRSGLIPTPTIEGRTHSILKLNESARTSRWESVPPIYGAVENLLVKDSAQVLLTGRTAEGAAKYPLLVTQRFGTGSVLLQLFDESWRWRSLDDGAPFRRYWSQVVRFLSKRKAIEDHPTAVLRTDRTEYFSGEGVKLTLSGVPLLDPSEAVRVVVIGPDGQTRDVTLNPVPGDLPEYTAEIEQLAEGTYSARPITTLPTTAPLLTTWKVLSVDPERVFQPMNEPDLIRSAELTGGKFYNVWEARRLPDDLPVGESRQLEQRTVVPLWNRWDMLLLLAAALVAEWTLRKRYRLV